MININHSNVHYTKPKSMALILSVLLLVSPLTACSSTQSSSVSVTTNQSTVASSNSNNSSSSVKQVKSLEDIHPTLTVEKWGSEKYYVIDEESLLQIIELCMDNVQEFYTEIGAPNMTYDKNLNIVPGKENFYPEWQNEYFYMARAMSESSRRLNLITTIPENTPDNYAHGIMQICPTSVKDTLEQYYSSIFNENIDLSNLEVIPTNEELANANTSKQAMQSVLEKVYNNIFLSMCFDVYNIKNLNPVNHQNYYANYGGYNEDVRRLATTAIYGTTRSTVINGMIKGNLRERLAEITDIDTYINNMEKYQAYYEQKYSNNNLEVDGMEK